MSPQTKGGDWRRSRDVMIGAESSGSVTMQGETKPDCLGNNAYGTH